MLNINNNILESFKTVNSFNLNDLIIEAKRLFTSYSDIKVINKTQSFEENTWVFEDLISADSPYKFDFNSFIPLIFFNKKVDTNQFILALKCWIINELNQMSPATVYRKFNNLYSICHLTKGFSTNFEELIETVRNKKIYSSRNQKKLSFTYNKVRSETIQRYIDCFISFTSFYHVLPVDKKVIAKLGLISNQFKDKSTSRDLPKPSEILNFKDCIETFYEDSINNASIEELIEYFPIILWWEITSIIPMRPSEFCLIKRDCISDNSITFPRIKQKRKNIGREKMEYDTLPIPNKLIEKISLYKKLTDKYGNSEYLVSFNAYKTLSLKLIKKNVDYENRYFSIDYLRKLINKFYEDIFINKYNLETSKKIKPGDLRHIAIISMMLQGYDRVEIQRLAGHFDINTQYSYVDHMHFWVDTEIQTLSDQFTLYNKDEYRSPHAIETFNTMFYKQIYSELSQTFTDNGESIKLEVGYCKDKTMPCPTFNWNYTGCYFCNNWGISMSELQDNKELIIKELSMIYNELHRKINYLGGLYNIHHLDKYGNINPEIKTELKLTTQEIEQDKLAVSKLSYMLGVESHE